MVKCGGWRIVGIIMNQRQNNYGKFGPFFTQRTIESPNLDCYQNMQERGIIESSLEFAKYANEFFALFLQE